MRLAVKVVPGSSRDALVGWLGQALKVCVRAPAERGKANKSVERLLAECLELTPKAVKIVGGKASARKWVEIQGLSNDKVCHRLLQAGVRLTV
jgi:uncharacterized protein